MIQQAATRFSATTAAAHAVVPETLHSVMEQEQDFSRLLSRPHQPSELRLVMIFRNLVAAAGLLLASCSSSATAPEAKDHVLEGRLGIFYEWADGSQVLQEVELLIDGQRASSQTFPTGVDRAFIDIESEFSHGGNHTVALRVVRQTRATVGYYIAGGVSAYRPSLGANSMVQYPVDASRTMRAGDKFEITFAVP